MPWLPNTSGTTGNSKTHLLRHRRTQTLLCRFFNNLGLLPNNPPLFGNNLGLFENNTGVFGNNNGVFYLTQSLAQSFSDIKCLSTTIYQVLNIIISEQFTPIKIIISGIPSGLLLLNATTQNTWPTPLLPPLLVCE